jgi:hypothetical protein
VNEDALEVELDDGTASLELRRQEIEDYHDVVNALQDGPEVPATVSFKVEWGGAASSFNASDSTFVFKGLKTEAMIAWSAEEAGFSFSSDPAHTSTANFAILGHERSGVFR